MKHSLVIILCTIFTYWGNLTAQSESSRYAIVKENGKIILAYRNFEDFLNSDKSWGSYRKFVFDACPEMLDVHKKILSWGSIDSLRFPDEIKNYMLEDWIKYFSQYDEQSLNSLYELVIEKANKVLPPIKNKMVDLCLFLPYPGCFVLCEQEKSLICISLLINPNDVQKIMAHEYAHNLHLQRFPSEPFRLKREIVCEGMAVCLTTLINDGTEIYNAIPFMTAESVQWCIDNEKTIKDSIRIDLNDSTFSSLKKYIADGMAQQPKGFVEKTGYFAGYQMIKACLKKGLKLEDICSMTSDEIIAKSEYFKE